MFLLVKIFPLVYFANEKGIALIELLVIGAQNTGKVARTVETVVLGAIVLNAKREKNNRAKRNTRIDHFFMLVKVIVK